MNVPLRKPFDPPSKHGFTGEDVLRMQEAGVLLEGGPFELIEGEIIDRPSEGEAHLALKIALNRFLVRSLPDEVALVPDGTLKLSEGNWPEPDFYLFPAAMRPGAVRGPDVLLLIEMSDSSLAHDLGVKADLYRRFGVREYWVIDLNAERLHVHKAGDAWPAPAVPLSTPAEAALVPGVRITLADLMPV